jgi:phenol hydroxylase P4 protein
MTVKALYDYTFPSADRQELFGDDQLVYVHWRGNPLFCSAACFRVPRTLTFGEFVQNVVNEWAGTDPDYDPSTARDWRLFNESLDAPPEKSLIDLGIGHKSLLTFSAG